MKKIILTVLLIMLTLFVYSEDMRKSLLVYTKGYSDSTGLIESKINEMILSMGKYRLLTRDDLVFKEIQLQLQGIVEGGGDLKQIKADALVYVDVIDTFQMTQKSSDGTSEWWNYEITVKYKLVDIQTGQILESQTYKGTGRSTISKYNPSSQALRTAKETAVDNVSYQVVSKLNTLFIIRANILSQDANGWLLIDQGRNHGVSKGMVFNFVKKYDVYGDSYTLRDGKLVVKDVLANRAFVKILEEPKKFDYRDKGITLAETPNTNAVRIRFTGYYMNNNLNFNRHGGGLSIAFDNYEGVYLGNSYEFFYEDSNEGYLNIGLDFGYMVYLGLLEVTPNLGLEAQIHFLNDSSVISLDVNPKLNLGIKLTDNIHIFGAAGYKINALKIDEQGLDLDVLNGLTIKGGLELAF